MPTPPSTPDARLVQRGAPLVAQALVRQAGYTAGIAHADGTALTKLLPDRHYLDSLDHLSAEVNTASKDKANAAAEAHHATSDTTREMRKLKAWRRKVVSRAKRARRLLQDVPDALLALGAERDHTTILSRVNDTLGLLHNHLTALSAAGDGAQTLIDEGTALYNSVKSADTVQQLKHLSELPQSVQAYFAKKGELFTAIQVVNDAGHELHADDHPAAARYNLRILRPAHTAAHPTTSPGTPPAESKDM